MAIFNDGTAADSEIGAVSPVEAYNILKDDSHAVLVDVRSYAEWQFIGVPDLFGIQRDVWHIELKSFPGMDDNPRFMEQFEELLQKAPSVTQLLFLCRSGGRSLIAARKVMNSGKANGIKLINVVEGFEGDLDSHKHRNTVNGWRFHQLPWRQS